MLLSFVQGFIDFGNPFVFPAVKYIFAQKINCRNTHRWQHDKQDWIIAANQPKNTMFKKLGKMF